MSDGNAGNLSLERIAQNQAAFREANERIELAAERMVLFGPVPFICECARPTCSEIARLTLDEYEALRAVPVCFFTVPGHQDLAVDAGAATVVAECPEYVVVDKIGIAGEIARECYEELAG